jgi:ABC-type iron transport system FetAB ATPase subunit/transcriptional regulator with XRE-family HTH domain
MGEFMSSNLFFQGMMYLVTLVYGGYLIANGEMQTADLAMYALYIGIFISPIQILVELVEMMQKGLSGFRRFLDVMETESEITDAPDARELTDVKGHVSYEHVSFHYSDDNTPVLSDISIDIPAGKSVALVGPSGGGKTTICSLLPRFYDVTEGRITVDGKDIRSLTLKSLRNNIGTVQQDVYLFDGTIRDNIAYGKPGASDEEIIAAAKRASIHDFIMELPQQYDTYVGERGTRLSGGQKQRISIMKNKTNVAVAVGERIRQFRTRQHLSQEELAFASEIHPAYIGKVERGEKCPTIETVSKIANGLKVSIPKLLDIDSNTEVEEEDAFHRIKVAMNGLSPEQMVKIAQIVEEITDFTQEPS